MSYLHFSEMKQHAIFDTELIGKKKPVFLTCVEIVETGERFAFWHDKKGHTRKLEKLLCRENLAWVGFNSAHFDHPLISMAVEGYDEVAMKTVAQAIIDEDMNHWQTFREFGISALQFDHIDLYEVAPGVKISLKAYAGRMHYKTMVDMPFHHDEEIADNPKKRKIVEDYCWNDIGVTKALFMKLQSELKLREDLSLEHDIDLRSKSDAQIAEAVLKSVCGIKKKDTVVPSRVTYEAPDWIKTKSVDLMELINQLEATDFRIDPVLCSPKTPAWLEDYEFQIKNGSYRVGLGGLHSTHDVKLHEKADENYLISDFDVGSYYPSIILKSGLVPKFGGNKGELFLAAYKDIFDRRMEAKMTGNKTVANSLKITLNGTYGKLGSVFSAFYSPDLMLAVTISGQLNLLCLIDELERLKGVEVLSANTDGITVGYDVGKREKVLKVFAANAKRTGFEYEETPYRRIAMKDVNNYFAVKTDGKVKTKGLYADEGLMKNPTMQVCTKLAIEYLVKGNKPEIAIKNYTDPKDYVEIRNVKGGGIQYDRYVLVDDWVLTKDTNSAKNEWMRQAWLDEGLDKKPTLRKSRPHPVEVGEGGEPFGRIARWYMTTKDIPPISYVSSGNRVAGTTGAKVCMNLPDKLPPDLNYEWYIEETYRILNDVGVL